MAKQLLVDFKLIPTPFLDFDVALNLGETAPWISIFLVRTVAQNSHETLPNPYEQALRSLQFSPTTWPSTLCTCDNNHENSLKTLFQQVLFQAKMVNNFNLF